jgi:hypothetical protein
MEKLDGTILWALANVRDIPLAGVIRAVSRCGKTKVKRKSIVRVRFIKSPFARSYHFVVAVWRAKATQSAA